jgi:hypothetical protein
MCVIKHCFCPWWQPWLAAQGEAGEIIWWVAIVHFFFLMVFVIGKKRQPDGMPAIGEEGT